MIDSMTLHALMESVKNVRITKELLINSIAVLMKIGH